VVEAILNVYDRREEMDGYRITYEPPFLRHFTAHFEPIG
jgi:tryptophanase